MPKTYRELEKPLKDYPHIISKIETYWGTKFCRKFLQELLLTDTPRNGFPFQIVLAITDLIELHDELYPQLTPKQNVWDDADKNLD